jgi:hypothetical protein
LEIIGLHGHHTGIGVGKRPDLLIGLADKRGGLLKKIGHAHAARDQKVSDLEPGQFMQGAIRGFWH